MLYQTTDTDSEASWAQKKRLSQLSVLHSCVRHLNQNVKTQLWSVLHCGGGAVSVVLHSGKQTMTTIMPLEAEEAEDEVEIKLNENLINKMVTTATENIWSFFICVSWHHSSQTPISFSSSSFFSSFAICNCWPRLIQCGFRPSSADDDCSSFECSAMNMKLILWRARFHTPTHAVPLMIITNALRKMHLRCVNNAKLKQFSSVSSFSYHNKVIHLFAIERSEQFIHLCCGTPVPRGDWSTSYSQQTASQPGFHWQHHNIEVVWCQPNTQSMVI